MDVKNTPSVTFHVIFSRKVIKNAFLLLHYLCPVSIGYLAVCAAEIYELELSYSPARCHYVDLNDITIKTEIYVLGSQALGAERRKSPSLAVKVLNYFVFQISRISLKHTAVFMLLFAMSGYFNHH